MKDFKDSPEGGQKKDEKQTERGGAGVESTINLAATIAAAMNGKSQGQLLQTIVAQAEQGKRDGTLTNADLDNFYNVVSPMLDGFRRKKLQQIITRLKRI